jgi:hypothetical protein
MEKTSKQIKTIKTMILLLTAIVPLILGIIWTIYSEYDEELVAIILTTLSAIWLIILLMKLTQRNEQRSGLREIEALKYTLQEARKSGDPIERAAFLQNIAKWNEKIANAKYWNEGLWDWWNVDEFANQPLIK